MSLIIKKGVLVTLTVCFFMHVEAQTNVSSIEGQLKVYSVNNRQQFIQPANADKVVLKGYFYTDSIMLDDTASSFEFDQVPYGVYDLEIEATGLTNLIIEDVLVNKQQLMLGNLFLYWLLDEGLGGWIKEDTRWIISYRDEMQPTSIYNDDGEILEGKGKYFIKKKYADEYRKIVSLVQKYGDWKYYNKDGKLMKHAYYDKGWIKKVVAFYENGNVKYKGAFDKILRVGNWLYFNPDGSLLFSIEFISRSIQRQTLKIKFAYLKACTENYQLVWWMGN